MLRQPLFLLLFLCCLMSANLRANDAQPAVVYLDDIVTAQGWREGNLSIHQPSDLRIAGRPAMHLHVPLEELDNKSWPKAWSPLVMMHSADWTKFDRLEFWVMARMRPPRLTPPKKLAVQFLCPDREHAISSTVMFSASDTWVHVSIPTRDQQVLQQLQAMQFYLAKRWYSGVDEVDFHIGGFRLVRDAGPLADECHLLTPFPSNDQPALRLQTAEKAPMQLHIEKDGRVLHEVRSSVNESGEHAVDLSSLNLSQGRYQLVAHSRDREARKEMAFDWQPLELESVSMGEGFAGRNVALVSLRNASPSPGQVEIRMRMGGKAVAQKMAMVPADASSQIEVDWPLQQGEKGKVSLQVHAGSSYVGGSSESVYAPDVYANLSPHRPVTFAMSQPIRFRLPLSLARGSRDQARMKWVLSDLQGSIIQTGHSLLQGRSASVQIDASSSIRAGQYAFHSTLELDGQTYKKAWNLYFMEDPFADLPLSLDE